MLIVLEGRSTLRYNEHMPTKQELHEELSELISVSHDTARTRTISMVGHALIELGLTTAIECGWKDCKFDTRKFSKDPSKRTDKMWLSIDHVIPIFLGGSDLPSNLMLLHLGCNSSKGALEYYAEPGNREKHGEISKAKWANPDYRAKNIAAQSSAQSRPEVVAAKSERMKAHWSDDKKRASHRESFQAVWDNMSPEERIERGQAVKEGYRAKNPKEQT